MRRWHRVRGRATALASHLHYCTQYTTQDHAAPSTTHAHHRQRTHGSTPSIPTHTCSDAAAATFGGPPMGSHHRQVPALAAGRQHVHDVQLHFVA